MAPTARASTRISIRWPPAAASEPTDTLVLSLDGYYVDLRVSKEDHSLDWALAGERITVSEDPLKVKFTHIINSQHSNDAIDHDDNGQPAEDVGDFVKLPNGDDFETGEMPAPHLNGKIAPYEEIWRQLSPVPANEHDSDHVRGSGSQYPNCEVGTVAWILESVDDGNTGNTRTKTFFARIGRFYLAIRSTNVGSGGAATFSALRQEYSPGTMLWREVYALGDITGMSLSSGGELATDREYTSWKVGEQVKISGDASETAAKEVCIVRAVGRLGN